MTKDCLTECQDVDGTWVCPVRAGDCTCAEGIDGKHSCRRCSGAVTSLDNLAACQPRTFCLAGGTACADSCNETRWADRWPIRADRGSDEP